MTEAVKKAVLSKETAADQVIQLLDYYEFDLDALPPTLRMAIESSLKQIETGVQKGRLEVEVTAESCKVKQYLKYAVPGAPNPLVYNEVSGLAKIGIRDDSSNYGKVYAFLGALCGEGPVIYQKMRGKDLSLAEALGSFFLQV